MKKNIQNQIGWILQEKYNGKLTNLAKKDIEKLKAGEPVDYLIGFIEFLDCKIDLSKRPLIPRVETQYWVGEAIDNLKIKNQNAKIRILDMFSGSGAIGVALLKKLKNAEVIFADSEKNCVEQIEINCKVNKINKEKYKIIKSDIFEKVNGKFDYIFANPPYIPDYRKNPSARLRTILKNRIQKSVLKYEPHVSLFGGKDGLLYVKKFLSEAVNFLRPNGTIFMEFDSSQKKDIEKFLKKLNYKNYEFQKDQYNKWRSVNITI